VLEESVKKTCTDFLDKATTKDVAFTSTKKSVADFPVWEQCSNIDSSKVTSSLKLCRVAAVESEDDKRYKAFAGSTACKYNLAICGADTEATCYKEFTAIDKDKLSKDTFKTTLAGYLTDCTTCKQSYTKAMGSKWKEDDCSAAKTACTSHPTEIAELDSECKPPTTTPPPETEVQSGSGNSASGKMSTAATETNTRNLCNDPNPGYACYTDCSGCAKEYIAWVDSSAATNFTAGEKCTKCDVDACKVHVGCVKVITVDPGGDSKGVHVFASALVVLLATAASALV
jgi:hypothetical protein